MPAFPDFSDHATLDAGFRGAVFVVGNFDGVHRGHRALIATARQIAEARGAPLGILTFAPHPATVLRPGQPLFLLTPPEDRSRLLAGTGADFMVTLAFDAALMAMSAEDFAERLLARRLGASAIVVGADFRYGKGRAGDCTRLAADGARLGFTVHPVEKRALGAAVISSSAVRAALAAGDVALAANLLGYWWFVRAEIVHGDKRGRDLGYPTANMLLDPGLALAHGIYAVRANLGGERIDGVASFGRRPTFDNGAPKLETFLFDFSGDLYGKRMAVEFVGRIRGEERFTSIEALIERMAVDCRESRAVLAQSQPDIVSLM
jgi:riboflavin kinase/FMN adenylyltransferase